MRQSAVRAVLVVLLAAAGTAFAEEAPKPPPPPEWKFALHGFVGGSVYGQDGFTGTSAGQSALWAAGAPKTDKFFLGGDIRQNRLNFSIAGPSVLGGTPRGVAEIDFFGGNGSGGFGDVSVLPRARVMYAELGYPNTTIRIGQEYSLIAGVNTLTGPATSGAMAFPTGVGHVAFPLTYGAGAIGWRYPGIFVYHRVPMGENKLELAVEIARSAWINPANSGTTSATVAGAAASIPYFTTSTGLGEASGIPQVEVRATYAMGTLLGVTVTGHYNSVDTTGAGASAVPTDAGGRCATSGANNLAGCGDKTVYAIGGNFRLNLAPIVFQGGGFIGQNTSPLLGEILQFGNLGGPDVSDWGAWAQLGFSLTKQLGIYALAGTEHPDWDNGKAAGVGNLSNVTTELMVRWFEGGLAYGLEWIHWHTRRASPITAAFPNTVAPVPETAIDANQLMFSMYYFF